jgi:hypothetical protein
MLAEAAPKSVISRVGLAELHWLPTEPRDYTRLPHCAPEASCATPPTRLTTARRGLCASIAVQ